MGVRACDVSPGRGWGTTCPCGTRRRQGRFGVGGLQRAYPGLAPASPQASCLLLSRGLGWGLDWKEEAEGTAFGQQWCCKQMLDFGY